MTEIASPSPFLSGADLLPPGQRDNRPRSGSVPSVPFGALVSEAAQSRSRPAQSRDADAHERSEREALPPREMPPRPNADANRPAPKAHRRTGDQDQRTSSGVGASAADDMPVEEARAGGVTTSADAIDDKACSMPGPGGEDKACADTPAPTSTDDMTAGPMTPPAEVKAAPALPPPTELTGGPAMPPPSTDITAGPMTPPVTDIQAGPALPPPSTDITAGPMTPPVTGVQAGPDLPPPVELTGGPAMPPGPGMAGLTADTVPTRTDGSTVATGIAAAADAMAETPAIAALAAIASGEKSAQGKMASATETPAIATPEGETPASPKGSADLVALLQARSTEGAGKTAPRAENAAAATEMPKTSFGDWINEFAFSQGAVHRSGDLVGSLDRALASHPTPHAGQDALRPTPLQMLPIEIGMQAVRGVKTFQIRLDPAELGRVEVKLEIREDGEVKANLVVDRVETLHMLKRDASTLQQAFEQAGLRQSPDGLSFQLRGEQQGREGQRENENRARSEWANESEEAGAARPAEIVMRRVMIPNSSLDLVI